MAPHTDISIMLLDSSLAAIVAIALLVATQPQKYIRQPPTVSASTVMLLANLMTANVIPTEIRWKKPRSAF
jgi:DNA-binding MurR/RpiR family transcriptional regulator